MQSWVEGVLALVVVVAVGVVMFLFSGESLRTDETEQTAPLLIDTEAAARGEQLAAQVGCLACHTIDGTPGTGPTFRGLAGSARLLETGETVIADDAYLLDAIVNPRAAVVEGFDPVMPDDYSDRLSQQEITDLVEYIKSLA